MLPITAHRTYATDILPDLASKNFIRQRLRVTKLFMLALVELLRASVNSTRYLAGAAAVTPFSLTTSKKYFATAKGELSLLGRTASVSLFLPFALIKTDLAAKLYNATGLTYQKISLLRRAVECTKRLWQSPYRNYALLTATILMASALAYRWTAKEAAVPPPPAPPLPPVRPRSEAGFFGIMAYITLITIGPVGVMVLAKMHFPQCF